MHRTRFWAPSLLFPKKSTSSFHVCSLVVNNCDHTLDEVRIFGSLQTFSLDSFGCVRHWKFWGLQNEQMHRPILVKKMSSKRSIRLLSSAGTGPSVGGEAYTIRIPQHLSNDLLPISVFLSHQHCQVWAWWNLVFRQNTSHNLSKPVALRDWERSHVWRTPIDKCSGYSSTLSRGQGLRLLCWHKIWLQACLAFAARKDFRLGLQLVMFPLQVVLKVGRCVVEWYTNHCSQSLHKANVLPSSWYLSRNMHSQLYLPTCTHTCLRRH